MCDICICHTYIHMCKYVPSHVYNSYVMYITAECATRAFLLGTYTQICTYICVSTYLCICTCIHTYESPTWGTTQVYMCTYLYIYIHAHTHICTNTYTHQYNAPPEHPFVRELGGYNGKGGFVRRARHLECTCHVTYECGM